MSLEQFRGARPSFRGPQAGPRRVGSNTRGALGRTSSGGYLTNMDGVCGLRVAQWDSSKHLGCRHMGMATRALVLRRTQLQNCCAMCEGTRRGRAHSRETQRAGLCPVPPATLRVLYQYQYSHVVLPIYASATGAGHCGGGSCMHEETFHDKDHRATRPMGGNGWGRTRRVNIYIRRERSWNKEWASSPQLQPEFDSMVIAQLIAIRTICA